ncbi:MAG TPA: A24 family peptidase [Bryobacteraceae bacterium]|jgi:prepilin peptidase CpaA|nr:A24 family peptidase [Bryobacteraceae bacterium]
MNPIVLPVALQLLLATSVVIAAIYDLRDRRIPNRLNLAVAVLGLTCNAILFHWRGVEGALLGAGLATLVYVPLYLLRGMGAGDVKLMFAIGAVAGPAHWFDIFVGTALIGAALGLCLAVLKQRLGHTLLNLQFLVSELTHFRLPHGAAPDLDVRNPQALRLPHGVSIALGSLTAILVPYFVPGVAH